MGELTGRVVVLTGATRGIGRAAALAFARAGARLVITGRSTDAAPHRSGLPGTVESVASEISAAGAEVAAVAADLASPEDVARVIQTTHDRFGGCDVLVNNAAVSFVGRFLDVPARRWRPVLDVNLLAPVALTHAFLPGMLERGDGRIVNVSSGAADTRRENRVPQLPYAASKAALDSFTFGLAHQLAGSGVAVNALTPEVMTESVEFSVTDPDVLAELRRRMVAPDAYAAAMVWLAAQPAGFTGQHLDNDALVALGALTADGADT